MDLDGELEKFVQTEVPLRQTREQARLPFDVVCDGMRLCAEARDISRGGIGATMAQQAGGDALAVGKRVRLVIKWPDDECVQQVAARVVWLHKVDQTLDAGFAFEGLNEEALTVIDRYLYARIVQRHIEA